MDVSEMRALECRYDAEADAAYICLADQLGPGEATRTIPVPSPDSSWIVNLDLDGKGRLVGLEVVGARRLLRPELLR